MQHKGRVQSPTVVPDTVLEEEEPLMAEQSHEMNPDSEDQTSPDESAGITTAHPLQRMQFFSHEFTDKMTKTLWISCISIEETFHPIFDIPGASFRVVLHLIF